MTVAPSRTTPDRRGPALVLGFPASGYHDQLVESLKKLVESIDGISSASIEVSSKVAAHKVQKGVKHLENIKNIIAVASGKGGVGKSTTAVNLALALSAEGARVGILDADIYGPSQPRMLGVSGKPESKDGKSLEPMNSYHLQAMSIGFLIDEETPMIWRGPMVTQALQQLLNDTNWKDLDYLVVDLPPGTGDIQLTLAQQVPVSGAVIVTTPQDIALLDARKGLKMFEKVEVPVLGIVENMSIHICSNCGHEESIFGTGGGQAMSDQYGVDLLGQRRNKLVRRGANLLLMDEPTARVDEASSQQIQAAALEARRERDTTLVIASHDWEWLYTICDTVLFLFRGQLIGLSTLFASWCHHFGIP